MNICFISAGQFNVTQGGIDRVCSQLVECFRKRGHVVLCCYLWESCAPDHDQELQFQFPDTEDAASERNALYLHDLLVRYKVDIICNHSFLIAQHDVCVTAKKGTSAKLVYTLHSDPNVALRDILDNQEKHLALGYSITSLWRFTCCLLKSPVSYYLRHIHTKKRFLKLYDDSDQCVMLSRAAAASFARFANVQKPQKLSVIPDPIPFHVNLHSEVARKKQVLFVGRLVWQKRVDRLLKVWKDIEKDFPEWTLVIVGDGPDKELYEKIGQSLSLKNISFVGSQSSESYYRASKILCLTSSSEGFSMVLIEAQQYGCVPVAYNSFPALADIIDDGVNGYAVTPFSEQEYISRLRLLMEDAPKRRRMAEEGMKTCRKFDVHNIAEQWEVLFKRICL
ncbi:glycosyltransferase [Akkermansia sp.]|uniref:glycosyltransferase n=1 Tax=Akkermansia sp. TaxID=1872421 RepID=UPI0025BD90A0|nr:glycosyltransferase [Akkermansia sp.]MCC8149666.1 glycosyltransferase [Akkermansia sp.]